MSWEIHLMRMIRLTCLHTNHETCPSSKKIRMSLTSYIKVKVATSNIEMEDLWLSPKCTLKVSHHTKFLTILFTLVHEDKVKKQHLFKAEGLDIYFPFKPYQCQVDFMSRVIKSLNNRTNALLESPTGTGKTLSLLCASLAWLKNYKDKMKNQQDMTKIIYTSRTHSQLA